MAYSKIVIFGFIAIVFIFGMTGCNTVQGAGKDLQKGGQAIEKAAE